jgi:hypothetical protein
LNLLYLIITREFMKITSSAATPLKAGHNTISRPFAIHSARFSPIAAPPF